MVEMILLNGVILYGPLESPETVTIRVNVKEHMMCVGVWCVWVSDVSEEGVDGSEWVREVRDGKWGMRVSERRGEREEKREERERERERKCKREKGKKAKLRINYDGRRKLDYNWALVCFFQRSSSKYSSSSIVPKWDYKAAICSNKTQMFQKWPAQAWKLPEHQTSLFFSPHPHRFQISTRWNQAFSPVCFLGDGLISIKGELPSRCVEQVKRDTLKQPTKLWCELRRTTSLPALNA